MSRLTFSLLIHHFPSSLPPSQSSFLQFLARQQLHAQSRQARIAALSAELDAQRRSRADKQSASQRSVGSRPSSARSARPQSAGSSRAPSLSDRGRRASDQGVRVLHRPASADGRPAVSEVVRANEKAGRGDDKDDECLFTAMSTP